MRTVGGMAAGVVAIALAGWALSGCSASSNGAASTSSGTGVIERAPAGLAPDQANGAPAGGSASSGSGGAAPKPAQQPLAPANQVPDAGRQVIRSATIGLRVSDLTDAASRVRGAVAGAGGYTATEDTESDHADFTLQVPVDSLDRVMDQLAHLGKVTNRTQQAQDVTEQLVDVRSRLVTQQASVDRVRALLGKATSIGDIVSVESELTKREADLESLEQRQAELSGQVALSTVTVHLSKQQAATPPPPARQQRSGFVGGLAGGWHAFVSVLGGAALVLGAVLPFAVLLGIPALWWWLRRRRTTTPRMAPNSTIPTTTPDPDAS